MHDFHKNISEYYYTKRLQKPKARRQHEKGDIIKLVKKKKKGNIIKSIKFRYKTSRIFNIFLLKLKFILTICTLNISINQFDVAVYALMISYKKDDDKF